MENKKEREATILGPKAYPARNRDYPISPRENILRALDHKKPLYMPEMMAHTQFAPMDAYGDLPVYQREDAYDWWGTLYKYMPAQGSGTPMGNVFNGIHEWREKLKWPDLDAQDWRAGSEGFVRDENRALFSMFPSGCFECLHAFEGFMNALTDLIDNPTECRAFFERMADHKIELFKRLNDVYHYDFVIYTDDWGTNHGPFFALDLFEETVLPPTIRIFDAMHAEGVKMVHHDCGKIGEFLKYDAESLHADGVQIQSNINNIEEALRVYGDKLTVLISADTGVVNDANLTLDGAQAYARKLVDTFGAANNPGAGIIYSGSSEREDVYYAIDDEIYRYSLEQYKAE